ncbi:hypothetical protein [Jatrophihabitans endophyticus]|uniref:hypothetical protein n=1 Tax=Jatrophihabitans endophyticus TaxID=1206085 RepID=UPI001A026573|nr:hypothetical protein [Jatrophihabitans endophyticus]MBE7187993.1 hypothetical protein [Jatrophihabitans endophyticus]
MPAYVRYQAAVPNRRGTHPGVFALCNGLARAGALSADDHRWWRASNDAFERAYRDPATVDPAVFDRARHPVVSCWFKATATHLLGRVDGYLDLLDRYGVGWECVRSCDPGRVLYEDDVQVVVEPS